MRVKPRSARQGNHGVGLGEDLLVGIEIGGTVADERLHLVGRVGAARGRKVGAALDDEISPEPAAGAEQPVIAMSFRVRPATRT